MGSALGGGSQQEAGRWLELWLLGLAVVRVAVQTAQRRRSQAFKARLDREKAGSELLVGLSSQVPGSQGEEGCSSRSTSGPTTAAASSGASTRAARARQSFAGRVHLGLQQVQVCTARLSGLQPIQGSQGCTGGDSATTAAVSQGCTDRHSASAATMSQVCTDPHSANAATVRQF